MNYVLHFVDFLLIHKVYPFLLTMLCLFMRIIISFLSNDWSPSESLVGLLLKVVKRWIWTFEQVFFYFQHLHFVGFFMEIHFPRFINVNQEIFPLQLIILKVKLKSNFFCLWHTSDFLQYFKMQNVINHDNRVTDSDALFELVKESFASECK